MMITSFTENERKKHTAHKDLLVSVRALNPMRKQLKITVRLAGWD